MKTRRQLKKKIRRIQNTERVMNRRLRIIKRDWCLNLHGYDEKHPWLKQPNRVNKYNLKCGCRMCSIKDKHTRKTLQEEAQLKEMRDNY